MQKRYQGKWNPSMQLIVADTLEEMFHRQNIVADTLEETFHRQNIAIIQCSFFGNVYTVFNPYPTSFPHGNGMVLHFYQQQESSATKTVHKVINKGLKTYV